MAGQVHLSIHNGRIDVAMPYDRDDLKKVKSVPGRRWADKRKMNTVPLDLETCRLLRELFDRRLVIHPELKRWAGSQVQMERNLGSLASSQTATLKRLPARLPKLYEAIHLGPRGRWMTADQRVQAMQEPASYQAADVAFLADAPAPLNANQPGLGKTLETIAAVFEEGRERGAHLVLAPVTSLETVWGTELALWQDLPVLIATGSAAERQSVLDEAHQRIRAGEALWVVANPTQVQRRAHPVFHGVQWNTLVVDEAHKAALGNTDFKLVKERQRDGSIKEKRVMKSVTRRALMDVLCDKRILLTGTPMGGKPMKLFGLLQFLRPDVFTSKWTWAGKYVHILDNGFGKSFCTGCRECDSGLLHTAKAALYASLIPYVLRRTKTEALPWLPPKQYVPLWVDMTPKQRQMYDTLEGSTYADLDGGRVSATGVLDMYTRLRQFATARCELDDGRVLPTTDSGKLPVLLELLEERGIAGEDREGAEQVVIFSQYEQIVTMLQEWLRSHDVPCARLTGKENAKQRKAVQEQFQAGQSRVLVMTTTAGGVAITLDNADTVIFLDETWNPDDQEQAEDRCHRASRNHQVTVYYLRSKNSIEEDVFDRNTEKQKANVDVMDVRRGIERRLA